MAPKSGFEMRIGVAQKITGKLPAPVIVWYSFRLVATDVSPCCCEDVNIAETTICSSLVLHHVCLKCARTFGEVEINVQAQ